LSFPSGFYWYGTKRSKPGQPHKEVLKQLANIEAEMKKLSPEATPGLDETADALMEKPETKKDKSQLGTSQKASTISQTQMFHQSQMCPQQRQTANS